MLKPVYFAFVKTMLEFFLQTTHFFKSRAHSPRATTTLKTTVRKQKVLALKRTPSFILEISVNIARINAFQRTNLL